MFFFKLGQNDMLKNMPKHTKNQEHATALTFSTRIHECVFAMRHGLILSYHPLTACPYYYAMVINSSSICILFNSKTYCKALVLLFMLKVTFLLEKVSSILYPCWHAIQSCLLIRRMWFNTTSQPHYTSMLPKDMRDMIKSDIHYYYRTQNL